MLGLVDELGPQLREVGNGIDTSNGNLVIGSDTGVVKILTEVIDRTNLRVPMFVRSLLDPEPATRQEKGAMASDHFQLRKRPIGPLSGNLGF